MTMTLKSILAPLWSRRSFAAGLIAGAVAFSGTASAQSPNVLRIGYQKYGTLTLLKARGDLEKRLAPQGIEVKWTEFPAGPDGCGPQGGDGKRNPDTGAMA